jgi:hypothetical protein
MARAQLSFNTDKQNLENMQWVNKIQRAQRTDILLSNQATLLEIFLPSVSAIFISCLVTSVLHC